MTNSYYRPIKKDDYQILGLDLSVPVMVGSGLLTDQERNIRNLLKVSDGAVVTKTIHPNPPKGLEERIQHINTGMLNSTTYSKRSINDWLDMLRVLQKDNAKIIVNIHADTPNEIAELANKIANVCGFPLELGISCLHADEGNDSPERVFAFANAVSTTVSRPFTVKLAIGEGLSSRVMASTAANASAVTISDTIPGIAFDAEVSEPYLGGAFGYSGQGIKPLVLGEIYKLRKSGVSIPIIGCGGINTPRCVEDYLAAGANVTQVYTALHTNMLETLKAIISPFKK